MKVMVALAAFAAILLLSVDIILGFAGKLPPWAIILLFIVSLLFFVFIAVLLVRSESRKKPPSTCRHVPIYPARRGVAAFESCIGENSNASYRSNCTKRFRICARFLAGQYLSPRQNDGWLQAGGFIPNYVQT